MRDENGNELPIFRVPASSFGKMDWVSEKLPALSVALLVTLALLRASQPFLLHLVDECFDVMLVLSFLHLTNDLLIVFDLRFHAVNLCNQEGICVFESLDALIQRWLWHSSRVG